MTKLLLVEFIVHFYNEQQVQNLVPGFKERKREGAGHMHINDTVLIFYLFVGYTCC